MLYLRGEISLRGTPPKQSPPSGCPWPKDERAPITGKLLISKIHSDALSFCVYTSHVKW